MSDRAADKGASGHTGQKSIGFGGTPTSIFAARKSQVSIHLPCLPLTRSPGNAAKKVGGVLPYVSDLSRALQMPPAALSMMISSFSFMPFSIRSMCFRRSSSPLCLSG